MVELFNVKGNDSTGVIDNASGVVAAHVLLKSLSEKPLQNTRVLIIATGAEEMGDFGTHWFMEKNEFHLIPESTQFLVLDSFGVDPSAGQNVILMGEGLPKLHYSKELEPIAKKLLQEKTYPLKIQWIPPGLQIQTDLVPVIRAGFQGLTIATTCFKFHSTADNWNLFNEETFRNIIRYIENLIRFYDK